MSTPTPAWLKKQNLTIDLYDTVKPRMGQSVQTKNDGLIRAVAKEVVQAGYRRIELASLTDDFQAMHDDLYAIIKPRVSVWIQTNQDDNLRKVLYEVLLVVSFLIYAIIIYAISGIESLITCISLSINFCSTSY